MSAIVLDLTFDPDVMSRREAGLLLGEVFDGVVTGASPKGTWVRLQHPIVEGRLDPRGLSGNHVQVGDRLRVKLTHVDPQKGFIDFVPLNRT